MGFLADLASLIPNKLFEENIGEDDVHSREWNKWLDTAEGQKYQQARLKEIEETVRSQGGPHPEGPTGATLH